MFGLELPLPEYFITATKNRNYDRFASHTAIKNHFLDPQRKYEKLSGTIALPEKQYFMAEGKEGKQEMFHF